MYSRPMQPQQSTAVGYNATSNYTLPRGFSSTRLSQSPRINRVILPTEESPRFIVPIGMKTQLRQIPIRCPSTKPNTLKARYRSKRQKLPPRTR